MSDSAGRLEMLRFARRVAELHLSQIDHWIRQEEQREQERRRGEQARPPDAEWVLEVGIGSRTRPVYVHVGGCHMVGKHWRGMGRAEALRALSDGADACPHCRPEAALGFLDG